MGDPAERPYDRIASQAMFTREQVVISPGTYYSAIHPKRVARTTASVRLCTPSLLMIALT